MIIRNLNNSPITAQDIIKIEVGKCKYEIRELTNGRISVRAVGRLTIIPEASNKIIIQEDPND